MVPRELFKVIFGGLSRDDMDALMLTNALFRYIVLRDFAKEPLRYYHTLHIYANQNYDFFDGLPLLSTTNNYRCEDNDDFSWRMRLTRVGRL
ncbi:hypothetical protein AAVH_43226, partial [Aphelenchoides avenae]